VIGMSMRYENRVDLLPAEIEPPERHLGSFPRVEEEEVPFAPEEHAGKVAVR